jgi:menaquinone-dependent protoporphyrinogen oxidase
MVRRVLIIYGTSYGQTEKIANRIASGLQRRGFPIELCNAAVSRPELPLEQYAGVVVGSSIIARGHQQSIKDFIRDHVATLNLVPSAFFQVSASAGSASPHAREAAQKILEEFVSHNGWMPVLSASLPGAINYTKYSLLLKWYMKRASAKNGGSTDTSRDHEYTDWAEVERFAMSLATAFRVTTEEVPIVVPAMSA